MRLGTTTLLGVAPTAAPQGNRSDIMTSYLFDKIPGGLLGGSRLQSTRGLEQGALDLLRVRHEARRRGRRQFENEGIAVRG